VRKNKSYALDLENNISVVKNNISEVREQRDLEIRKYNIGDERII
jgi:hypothetical protein